MASKRMFSIAVIDTDKFLDLPSSSQALYFHLGMRGDDDGFVASPRKIVRSIGANDDDLRLLASKGFIIPFDSGVIVITDWYVNNFIRKDRYAPTIHLTERALLGKEPSGRYTLESPLSPNGIPDDNQVTPQISIDKISLDKSSIIAAAPAPKKKKFIPPGIEEVAAYCSERGNGIDPQAFVDFYAARDWRSGKSKIMDWKACIRTWERNQHKQSSGRAECEFDYSNTEGSL